MQKHSSFIYKSIALTGLLVFFFACQRQIEAPIELNYSYFPLQTGKYKIYQIDSVVYDEYNCNIDTVRFQLKEITADTIRDGEGALAYKIERYQRLDSTHSWRMIGVWLEKIEDYQVQRVEENQRMIKMVFPVKQNQKWDGIVYIRRDTLVPIRGSSIDMFKDWDNFVYTDVDVPYRNPITSEIYPQTVLIQQVDKINNIERRYSTERYAKNIGLVSKKMMILDTQCRVDFQGNLICSGTGDISKCLFKDWTVKAEKGFILQQTLIEHNY